MSPPEEATALKLDLENRIEQPRPEFIVHKGGKQEPWREQPLREPLKDFYGLPPQIEIEIGSNGARSYADYSKHIFDRYKMYHIVPEGYTLVKLPDGTVFSTPSDCKTMLSPYH